MPKYQTESLAPEDYARITGYFALINRSQEISDSTDKILEKFKEITKLAAQKKEINQTNKELIGGLAEKIKQLEGKIMLLYSFEKNAENVKPDLFRKLSDVIQLSEEIQQEVKKTYSDNSDSKYRIDVLLKETSQLSNSVKNILTKNEHRFKENYKLIFLAGEQKCTLFYNARRFSSGFFINTKATEINISANFTFSRFSKDEFDTLKTMVGTTIGNINLQVDDYKKISLSKESINLIKDKLKQSDVSEARILIEKLEGNISYCPGTAQINMQLDTGFKSKEIKITQLSFDTINIKTSKKCTDQIIFGNPIKAFLCEQLKPSKGISNINFSSAPMTTCKV